MVTEEGGVPDRERKMAAVSEAITQLWRPEAGYIMGRIVEGCDMVVVGGRGGSGKSENLTPNLISAAGKEGHPCVRIDCQTLPGKSAELILPVLTDRINHQIQGQSSNCIIILDEPIFDKEGVSEVLELLYDDLKFVAVIPLFRVQLPEERGNPDLWLKAAELTGRKAVYYELQSKKLPTEIAREFLTRHFGVSEDLIDYIINSFPLYTRVLARLGASSSIAEINKLWTDMSSRINDGWGFDQEEAEEVNERLGR